MKIDPKVSWRGAFNGMYTIEVCVSCNWTDVKLLAWAKGKCLPPSGLNWQIRNKRKACKTRRGFVHLVLDVN